MSAKISTVEIQQLAQFAMDHSSDPIFWIDPDARLVYVNETTCRVLGYTQDELLEMTVFDVDPAFPQEAWPNHWQELKQRVFFTIESQHQAKDGRIFPVELAMNYLEFNEQEYVCTFARDISERKQFEAEIEERTREMQKFKSLVENNGDFIGYLDVDANASVYVNPAGAKMMGYDSTDEVIGKPLPFFHPVESLAYMDEHVVPQVMKGEFWRGENRLLRRDGSTIPVNQILFLIHDEKENRYLLSTVMTDISERKQAEAEREKLQQEVIDAQQRAIAELSTPVIPVMDRIIVMPLVGSIDTMRARDITRSLLAGISQNRAKVVILDVTGVSIMDTGVVNHLNKTIQAARLKGARTIVTGISDSVAEAIVDLGIDWSGIETLSDLQTGLVSALDSLGLQLRR